MDEQKLLRTYIGETEWMEEIEVRDLIEPYRTIILDFIKITKEKGKEV